MPNDDVDVIAGGPSGCAAVLALLFVSLALAVVLFDAFRRIAAEILVAYF